MSRVVMRPYLVAKDEAGAYQVTVRTMRRNSQGYPLHTSELLAETFPTATSARAHLRERYGAQAADIAIK